ncbi:hypothetical protein N7456_013576 [Penicillium angulare]|uniref:CCHC-type domain-containing protein n=1 Tax=Penicillium angulare TaxID=116970 RepID=A0A9W9JT22_9EURO|nr:hypothetical protein N7456_013576 [Penicillium angulare]
MSSSSDPAARANAKFLPPSEQQRQQQQQQQQQRQQQQPQQPPCRFDRRICWKCVVPGHIARECTAPHCRPDTRQTRPHAPLGSKASARFQATTMNLFGGLLPTVPGTRPQQQQQRQQPPRRFNRQCCYRCEGRELYAEKEIGIYAREVALSDEGSIQFNPSFFHPLEPSLQSKYPIEGPWDHDTLHWPFPSWDQMLKEAAKRDCWCMDEDGVPIPGAEDFLEHFEDYIPSHNPYCGGEEAIFDAANGYFQSQIELWKNVRYSVDLDKPRSTISHVDNYVCARRKGLPNFAYSAIDYGLDYPVGLDGWTHHGTDRWTVETVRVVKDKGPAPLPHAIMTMWAEADATTMSSKLTLYEVRAILRFFLNRCSRRFPKPERFSTYLVQPVLLIAYLGRNHGRITQAFYDGSGLNLQYSPLISFELEEDEPIGPIDLFFRYLLSDPVGITQTKCIHRPKERQERKEKKKKEEEENKKKKEEGEKEEKEEKEEKSADGEEYVVVDA